MAFNDTLGIIAPTGLVSLVAYIRNYITWCDMAARWPTWAGTDFPFFSGPYGEYIPTWVLTWSLPDRDSIYLYPTWMHELYPEEITFYFRGVTPEWACLLRWRSMNWNRRYHSLSYYQIMVILFCLDSAVYADTRTPSFLATSCDIRHGGIYEILPYGPWGQWCCWAVSPDLEAVDRRVTGPRQNRTADRCEGPATNGSLYTGHHPQEGRWNPSTTPWGQCSAGASRWFGTA